MNLCRTISADVRGIPNQRRRELEDIWCVKVEKARAKYDAAFAKSRAIYLVVQNGSRDDDALRKAHEEESAAICEYLRVLRIYTDLLVRRRIPPEE